MGDGIQRKFAIILNGDVEPRHLENVDRAVAALKAEGVEHIAVAREELKTEVRFSNPTR